jgi:hypothetical protein
VSADEAPRLNAAAARGLDAITRAVVSAGFEAIKLTFLSRSWKELGYASFEAWAAGMPKYQLSRDERKALVTELDGLGMTQRQIAATVGTGVATVNRDLDVPDGTAEEPTDAPARLMPVPDGTAQEEAPPAGQEPSPATPPPPTLRPVPEPDPEPKPDLHKAAAATPETDKGFRSTVDQVLAMLVWLDPENNQPITEVKIKEARRVLDRIEELRQGWLPYLQTQIREVR